MSTLVSQDSTAFCGGLASFRPSHGSQRGLQPRSRDGKGRAVRATIVSASRPPPHPCAVACRHPQPSPPFPWNGCPPTALCTHPSDRCKPHEVTPTDDKPSKAPIRESTTAPTRLAHDRGETLKTSGQLRLSLRAKLFHLKDSSSFPDDVVLVWRVLR